MRTCVSCNEALEAGWVECPACLTPVAPTCPGCGRAIKPSWRRCPGCQRDLMPSAATPNPGPSAGQSPPSAAPGGASTPSSAGSFASPFLSAFTSGDPRGAPNTPGAPAASPGAASPLGAPLAQPDLPQGLVLAGKYRIEGVLGRGGFGTVYRAFDEDLGEVVALKAVATFGDPDALRRQLAEEFKAQRNLADRTHLLASYPPQRVEALGVTWVLLPMELGQGTLRDWLQAKGGKPEHLAEGLALLRQAVQGLAVLHAAGIVHRDVKPENLLLIPDPAAKESGGVVVKVGDFGLAGSLEKLAAERPELVGDGIGTPAYMAPEQVEAAHWKDVTAAADAYAVGTILFELLDGERPYSGTAQQLREKKRKTTLKPRTPAGPAQLAELALALLQPERAQRPALGAVLTRLVDREPAEVAYWAQAEAADTEEGYAGYLETYPVGPAADRARARLGDLQAARELREAAAQREATARAAREADERAAREGEARAREARERPERVLRGFGLGRDQFVEIAAGTFRMGSTNGDGDEQPVHEVRVTRGFWLQKTPVTQGQWEAVMGGKPSHFEGDPQRPVEQVSWEDAQGFIAKLNAAVGSAVFRLPTEAEWEYACRAGTTGDYAGPLDAMAWYGDNSGGTTHAVGTKAPNAWGLYDMHGNVWEWCADWYDAGYYAQSPRDDPTGPATGSSRVLRGGGWVYGAFSCRSAYRVYVGPTDRDHDFGFRLLRT